MDQDSYESLTPMERNCLRLAHHERKAEQIAHELGIKPSTVNTHIFSARRKLGGISRLSAADQLRAYEVARSEVSAVGRLIKLTAEPDDPSDKLLETTRELSTDPPQQLSRHGEWMADRRGTGAEDGQPTEVREPRSAFVFDMRPSVDGGRDEGGPLPRIALILAIALLAALVLIAAPAIYDSAATRIANSLEPPHQRLPRP